MGRIVQGIRSGRSVEGRERILLVRLDAIGDYVLFRNHLRFLRRSERFRDSYLTILGNPAWRDLAETFDADCADEWLWLSEPGRYFKKGYENLLPHRIWGKRVRTEQGALRETLKRAPFDCVLSPRVNRDPLLDSLLTGIAPRQIGAKSAVPSDGDHGYTSLLDVEGGPFIFDRNRSFMEALTGEHSDARLHLEIQDARRHLNREEEIILCVGASHWTRRTPCARLTRICEALLEETPLQIILSGGSCDKRRAMKIFKALGGPPRVSITAGSPLSDFVRMASKAACVISHDTGTMHIAASLGVPVVGICNGYSGKGTFWPYPDGRVRMCMPAPPLPPLSSFLPLAQLQAARAIRSIPVSDIVSEVLSVCD